MPIEGPSTAAVRDFIDEDEQPTPAEQARIARTIPRDLNAIVPNFIPDPDEDPVERLPREAQRELNERVAEEAAARRAERWEAHEYETAVRKLNMLSARSAVEFIQTLSPRLKRVYARAELDGQARATVLKVLKPFMPE